MIEPGDHEPQAESIDPTMDRMAPFVSSLYEDGNPSLVAQEDTEDTHSPLYDGLRHLKHRYTEQTLIATGGMKEIYRAYDQRTSRHVAIARPLQTLGKDYYDAFLREAHLTARLEHPGIIKLFGMDVDEDGKPFFTMEFKTGRSLREIIKDYKAGKNTQPWPISQRLRIILRICESLAYAHSQRVLHLDVKPDNIQVGSFGEVQLCDWGMGVVIRGQANNQSETLLDPDLYGSLNRKIKGTPAYMAPELFDAKNAKTPQMDIYALGCLMEELLFAESPTAEKDATLSPDSAIIAVVKKAKARAPSDRYSTVAHMQQDIARYLDGFSMSVGKSSPLHELSLFYRRHRPICNVSLAFILVFLSALTVFLYNLSNSRNEAQAAKTRAVEALADLKKEKNLTESRLKQQAKAAQIGSKNLIQLEFSDRLNLETLAEQLHSRLDAVIANQPTDDEPIWITKFWLSFLTQDFEQALQLHEAGKKTPDDLVPLTQKYAARLDDADYLSTADFNELLAELFAITNSARVALAEKMMRYDLKNPRSIEDRVKIVHQMLKLLNPAWENQIFSYSKANHSIRLSGKGLKRLRLTKNLPTVLNVLNPRKLDMRHTSITTAGEVKFKHLTEIDLRHTPIKSLKPLADMRALSRIIVARGQIPEKDLHGFPSYIKVIQR